MPDTRIITEVAGRVCALSFRVGDPINEGDEIAFVEAMKMEIPVTATVSGILTSLLVKLDDVLTEGQVVAVIEA